MYSEVSPDDVLQPTYLRDYLLTSP